MLLLLRFFTFFYVFQNPKKRDFLRFFAVFHTFSRTMTLSPWNPWEYPHKPYIDKIQSYLATSSSLTAVSIVYLDSNFPVGLRKTHVFWTRVRNFPSRSSKVVYFGTNRKRVYDFLLVSNSNIGPVLPRFGDIAGFLRERPHPYSTRILGVFPLD